MHPLILLLGLLPAALGSGDAIEIIDVDDAPILDILGGTIGEAGSHSHGSQESSQMPFTEEWTSEVPRDPSSSRPPHSSSRQPQDHTTMPTTPQPRSTPSSPQPTPTTRRPTTIPSTIPAGNPSTSTDNPYTTPSSPTCGAPHTCQDGNCNYVINIPTGGGGNCQALEALIKTESREINSLSSQVADLSAEISDLRNLVQNFVNAATPCLANCNKTKPDPCQNYPCGNGGTCFVETYGPHCECPQPFSGKHCEISPPPTPTPSPCAAMSCLNNGTCVISNGVASCVCPEPFFGPNCEDINHCASVSNPCLYGNCTNTPNGAVCHCKPLYTGAHCDVPFCEPGGYNPCRHDGNCTIVQNSTGLGYQCACPSGWTGPNCNQNINECLSSPCGCNSSCIDLPGSYMCKCQKGYNGVDCCSEIDYCATDPCENGATCVRTHLSYNCICPGNAVGPNCSKVLHCHPDSCGPHALCYVAEQRVQCACQPGFSGDAYSGRGCSLSTRTTCVNGDPHFRSLDGLHFNYQGTCPTVLAKPCSPGQLSAIPPFTATLTDGTRWRNARVSYAKSLALTVYGKTVTIGRKKAVTADGLDVYLPWFYPNRTSPQVWVKPWGFHGVILETDFHLKASFSSDWSVCLTVPQVPELDANICGLAGNMDGHYRNDLSLRNGTSLWPATQHNVDAFGDSWISADDGKCFHGADMTPTRCPNPDAQRTVRQQCAILSDPSGPFAACGNASDVAAATANCEYDLCAYWGSGEQDQYCSVLTDFAAACQAAYPGTPLPWRSATRCPMACGAKEVYSPCGSSCPATCPDPKAPLVCVQACTEGCQCAAGYVLDNGACILPVNCGCEDPQGLYHPANSSWVDGTCSSVSTCSAGQLTTTNLTCAAHASCGLQNGHQDCFCDAGFQGDGRSNCSDVNECLVSATCVHGNCTNLPGSFACHCDPNYTGTHCETHINYCQNVSCHHGGHCQDTGYGFQCDCVSGYYGLYCDSTPQRHCADLMQYHGVGITGNYPIRLPSGAIKNVYCDMDTEGGGWTVFLKRFMGSVDFYRSWAEYRDGFGMLYTEFWLGNALLHTLTNEPGQAMRVRADLTYCDTNKYFEEYDGFNVGDEASKFTLSVSGPRGTAGDSIAFPNADLRQNGTAFSTFDQENSVGNNCTGRLHAGFWFANCGAANPTGRYYSCAAPPPPATLDAMYWFTVKNDNSPASVVQIGFRPTAFIPIPHHRN